MFTKDENNSREALAIEFDSIILDFRRGYEQSAWYDFENKLTKSQQTDFVNYLDPRIYHQEKLLVFLFLKNLQK